jgi:hypothetical protein
LGYWFETTVGKSDILGYTEGSRKSELNGRKK